MQIKRAWEGEWNGVEGRHVGIKKCAVGKVVCERKEMQNAVH